MDSYKKACDVFSAYKEDIGHSIDVVFSSECQYSSGSEIYHCFSEYDS